MIKARNVGSFSLKLYVLLERLWMDGQTLGNLVRLILVFLGLV